MSFSEAVFLDYASIHPEDLDTSALNDLADNWRFFDNAAPDEVMAGVGGAELIVSNKVVLDRPVLQAATRLKLVCIAATGVNNIDRVAAKEQGITVCNVPAYATPSVVQHVFSLLLALTTQHTRYQQAVVEGRWSQSPFFCLFDYPVRELQGLNMGIVGYGELGRAVAAVAEAFGMNILLARRNADDRRPGRVPLDELLTRADVVSLHCPLTEDTRNLIGTKELALMKADAILVNTARGGLVDEQALLAALKSGQIGGAALDVLAQEPPPADYFLLQQQLPNLIITPHVAWASRQARQRLVDEIAENIRAFLRGEPRNVVN